MVTSDLRSRPAPAAEQEAPKMSKKTAKSSAAKAKTMVSAEQWKLPVGISETGELISLKEAVRQEKAALSFGQLSPADQAKLVVARIEKQPKFELAMVGAGVVDKERAVKEVNAQTPVGRTLIEIEQRTIARVMKKAQEEPA